VTDEFAAEVAAQGDDDEIRAILEEVCAITDMGFAAVARVTEERWIAAQVLDKIEFGLEPAGELRIKTTICDEIRQNRRHVVFDSALDDPHWRTHPVPMLYGFQSYAALPLVLPDGSFYGTLCAIDPKRRSVSSPKVIAGLEDCAARVVAILTKRLTLAGI
jgi:GAF domain-containing protein